MASSAQRVFCFRHQRIKTDLDIPQAYGAQLAGMEHLDLIDGLDCGSIHFLFRPEAFVKACMSTEPTLDSYGDPIDLRVYRNGMPAFALATTWLRQGMGFLSAILYAPRLRDSDGNEVLSPKPSSAITEKQRNRFEVILEDIADRMRICTYEPEDDADTTHGMAKAYYASFMSEEHDPIVYRISCCAGMWKQLSSSDWDARPISQKCTTWVMIAVTLMHEIAHLLWLYTKSADILDDWYADGEITLPTEPRIQPYTDIDELGFAWEQYQLGGAVWQGRKEMLIAGKMRFHPVHDGTLVSVVHLMRKSTWSSGEPVKIYLLPLVRRKAEIKDDTSVDEAEDEDTEGEGECEVEDECEAEDDNGDYSARYADTDEQHLLLTNNNNTQRQSQQVAESRFYQELLREVKPDGFILASNNHKSQPARHLQWHRWTPY